jgi:5-methylcytosine-specific restriction endonuclease McrA
MTPRLKTDSLRVRCRAALAEQRRWARAEGQALDYGLIELEALAGRSVQCYLCRMPVGWGLQFDHKTPIARGGRHVLGNLAVCCARCNQIKGKLTEPEFAQLLALARTWHPAAGEDLLGRLRHGGRRYRGVKR